MTQRISSDRALLPTTEARKITGFSSAYIQRLLREQRIEGIKLGPIWLVYEDSLNTFIAQPRKRGPKGPHNKSKQLNPDTTLPKLRQTATEPTKKEAKNGRGKETKDTQ